MNHPLSHQVQKWDREGEGALWAPDKEAERSRLGTRDTYFNSASSMGKLQVWQDTHLQRRERPRYLLAPSPVFVQVPVTC